MARERPGEAQRGEAQRGPERPGRGQLEAGEAQGGQDPGQVEAIIENYGKEYIDDAQLVPRSLDQCIAQFRRDACSAWRKCAYASSQYFCFVVVGNVGDFRKLQHGWL